MKNLVRFAVVLSAVLVTSSAMADKGSGPLLSQGAKEVWDVNVGGDVRLVDVPYDVSNIESWDAQGSPNNILVMLDVAVAAGLPSGTPMTMTGVGWDVTLQAFEPSWLSEISVLFDNSSQDAPEAIVLRPGVADGAPGGPTAYSSGGVLDFGDDAGLDDIPLPDGVLSMEFFESFDDAAGVIDGLWVSGTLTLAVVPEPVSLLLMGLGALVLRRR
jgi:hypothetical protein